MRCAPSPSPFVGLREPGLGEGVLAAPLPPSPSPQPTKQKQKSVCVKASPAAGWRRLHTNTAMPTFGVSAGLPTKHRQPQARIPARRRCFGPRLRRRVRLRISRALVSALKLVANQQTGGDSFVNVLVEGDRGFSRCTATRRWRSATWKSARWRSA